MKRKELLRENGHRPKPKKTACSLDDAALGSVIMPPSSQCFRHFHLSQASRSLHTAAKGHYRILGCFRLAKTPSLMPLSLKGTKDWGGEGGGLYGLHYRVLSCPFNELTSSFNLSILTSRLRMNAHSRSLSEGIGPAVRSPLPP